MYFFLIQYLGFGMPASSSEGRRAAQASASPMDDDQLERDASLRKVQAKDLVEFGMIPVRNSFRNSFRVLHNTFIIYLRNLSAASQCLCLSIVWMLIC